MLCMGCVCVRAWRSGYSAELSNIYHLTFPREGEVGGEEGVITSLLLRLAPVLDFLEPSKAFFVLLELGKLCRDVLQNIGHRSAEIA